MPDEHEGLPFTKGLMAGSWGPPMSEAEMAERSAELVQTIADVQEQLAQIDKALAEAKRELALLPKFPEPFDYSVEECMERAKAGSVADAMALLKIFAAALRKRDGIPPLDDVGLVPGWMADYFASAIDKIVAGVDPARALRIRQHKGNSKFLLESRDRQIAFLSEIYRWQGHKDFLRRTVDALNKRGGRWAPTRRGKRPQDGESLWTEQSVAAVIRRHRRKVKSPDSIATSD